MGAVTAAGVASAGVGGGIKATIEMNLHDIDPDGPNGPQKPDGRIRISELIENFKHGPLCIFDFRGSLGVTLSAFLSVVGITYRFEIADITIISFDFSCGVTNDPQLATVLPDGTLRLNMGPYASERQQLNTEDGDENFSVKYEAFDESRHEDRDGDGQLDPLEDMNANEKLDVDFDGYVIEAFGDPTATTRLRSSRA
jgi:hypothetical protein